MTHTTPVDHHLPLVLHRNQTIELPLPGGVAVPGSLVWGAESSDPHVVAVSVAEGRPEASHPTLVVWQLRIAAKGPGRATIKVHETAATHPVTTRYAFTLEVTVLESTQVRGGIMLLPSWDNLLHVGGELGWYSVQNNASTGYRWVYVPDQSGVYALVEEITLHASLTTPVVGAPGSMTIRKWKAVKKGHGVITFQHIPPGADQPAEVVTIRLTVK